MKTAVLIKQVIDVTFPFEMDPDTCEILQDDLFYWVNPADVCASQLAVDIKRKYDGEVTFISLGPPRVERALRHCLALGGDRAIHFQDESVLLDTQTIPYILAEIICRLSPDLILCGSRSLDQGSGQIPSALAERLDLPQVTGVTDIEISSDGMKAVLQRKLEKGRRMSLECPIPAVFAVEPEMEPPAYAPLPGWLEATTAEITRMDGKTLNLDTHQIRTVSARNQLVKMSLPRLRPKKTFFFDSNLSAEERMELIMSGGLQQTKSDILEGDPQDLAQKLTEILAKEIFDLQQ